jgi:hypothetical protein
MARCKEQRAGRRFLCLWKALSCNSHHSGLLFQAAEASLDSVCKGILRLIVIVLTPTFFTEVAIITTKSAVLEFKQVFIDPQVNYNQSVYTSKHFKSNVFISW